MHQLIKTKNSRWFVGTTFLIFITIRLLFLSQHIYFGQDEARDLLLSQRALANGELIAGYGPKASVGDFYLPPFYYQLHRTVTAIFGTEPLVMHVVTLIIDSLGAIILYFLLRLFFSRSSSLAGALIYAFSYQPFTQGVNSWNPNLIPVATLALLYSSALGIVRSNWKFAWLAVLTFTISVHLHYQAIVLLPFLAWVFAKSIKPEFPWRSWAAGIVSGGIITLPYFVSELRSNLANSRAIINYFQLEHHNYFDRIGKIEYVTKFIPQFFERVLAHEQLASGWLGLFLLIVGLMSVTFLMFKKKLYSLTFFLVYFGSVLLMLRLYKGDKLDYYMSTLFILPAFVLAAATHAQKHLGLVITVIVLGLSVNSIIQLPPRNQINELRDTIREMRTTSQSESARLLIHTDDFVNTLAFALPRYGEMSIDQSSLTVLEVFPKDRAPLQPSSFDSCASSNSDSYTNSDYYEQFKKSSGFKPTKLIENPDFDILVGQLTCQPTPVKTHPLYQDQGFGSDLVVPNIYK